MTFGILLVVLLAAAAVVWILAPLARADAAEVERVARADSEAVELQSRREMVLGALKDLEEDRATDKITDEDYAGLQTKLTAQAVDIMKRIDALDARGPKRVPPSSSPGDHA